LVLEDQEVLLTHPKFSQHQDLILFFQQLHLLVGVLEVTLTQVALVLQLEVQEAAVVDLLLVKG
jgi:hypothetical protein